LKVSAFRQLINSESDLSQVIAAARGLYDLLVRPAEREIVAGSRLLISPDGPLHSLPFAALARGSDSSMPIYLGVEKPIHMIVSSTLYAEVISQRHNTAESCSNLVAFGAPDYHSTADAVSGASNVDIQALNRRGARFDPLPATKREVEAVAQLFPNSAKLFIGSQATESNAKAIPKNARFIHFACHGFLDRQFPFDSALALTQPATPNEADNGLLQAREVISSMHLDADLVALSACDTAQGVELGGEGLLGLTRAFQYAGARSVLGSLWSVADESTAVFMQAFYSALCKGLPKDQALQSAQGFMVRETRFAHPFFWAAFQLTGDWR